MIKIKVSDPLIFIETDTIKRAFGPDAQTVINRYDIVEVPYPEDTLLNSVTFWVVLKGDRRVAVKCDNIPELHMLRVALDEEAYLNTQK